MEKGEDEWLVTVPSHRRDIELEADLVEEVARIWGTIKSPLPCPTASQWWGTEPKSEAGRPAGEKLVGCGLHEALTYSFIPPKAMPA